MSSNQGESSCEWKVYEMWELVSYILSRLLKFLCLFSSVIQQHACFICWKVRRILTIFIGVNSISIVSNRDSWLFTFGFSSAYLQRLLPTPAIYDAGKYYYLIQVPLKFCKLLTQSKNFKSLYFVTATIQLIHHTSLRMISSLRWYILHVVVCLHEWYVNKNRVQWTFLFLLFHYSQLHFEDFWESQCTFQDMYFI